MPSETLTELLDHLVERERATDYDDLADRLRIALYELTDDDIDALLGAVARTATYQSQRSVALAPSLAYDVSVLTIGVILGRELERRANA